MMGGMAGSAVGSRAGGARGAVLSTFEIVVLGCAAHALAGGSLAPGPLVALTGGVGLAAWCLASQLVRLPVALVAAGGAQVLLHAAMADAGSHVAHTGSSYAGHDMVLAHALSVVVSTVVLVWQEQAFGALLRRVAPVDGWLAPIPLPAAPVRSQWQRPTAPRRLTVLTRAPRRGPPAVPDLGSGPLGSW